MTHTAHDAHTHCPHCGGAIPAPAAPAVTPSPTWIPVQYPQMPQPWQAPIVTCGGTITTSGFSQSGIDTPGD